MLFIGVALLIAVGLALLINADAGSLVGLDKMQTGQLVPLVLILILVAAGAFSRRRRLGEMLGGVLLWVGIFGAAIVGYTLRDEIMDLPARVFGELRPGVAVVNETTGTATFRKGAGNHFVVQADVNGAVIPLLFDTGASAVVLTPQDARKAGIDTATLRYDVPVSTANGTGQAALVRLDRIEIGGITREGIRAFVAGDDMLESSLLGMTFLSTLTRYSVSSDTLEMHD